VAESVANMLDAPSKSVRRPKKHLRGLSGHEETKKVFLLGIAVVVVVRTMWKIAMENDKSTQRLDVNTWEN
jgi:hypothetical protein